MTRFADQIHREIGVAAIKTGLDVRYSNQWTKVAIVKSRNRPRRFVESALPFISLVDNNQVRVHSLYTGASIFRCFLFLKKYQQGEIMQALRCCENDEEKRYSIGSLLFTSFRIAQCFYETLK